MPPNNRNISHEGTSTVGWRVEVLRDLEQVVPSGHWCWNRALRSCSCFKRFFNVRKSSFRYSRLLMTGKSLKINPKNYHPIAIFGLYATRSLYGFDWVLAFNWRDMALSKISSIRGVWPVLPTVLEVVVLRTASTCWRSVAFTIRHRRLRYHGNSYWDGSRFLKDSRT